VVELVRLFSHFGNNGYRPRQKISFWHITAQCTNVLLTMRIFNSLHFFSNFPLLFFLRTSIRLTKNVKISSKNLLYFRQSKFKDLYEFLIKQIYNDY